MEKRQVFKKMFGLILSISQVLDERDVPGWFGWTNGYLSGEPRYRDDWRLAYEVGENAAKIRTTPEFYEYVRQRIEKGNKIDWQTFIWRPEIFAAECLVKAFASYLVTGNLDTKLVEETIAQAWEGPIPGEWARFKKVVVDREAE